MFLEKTKYSGTPKYRCDKCHKIISDYKPRRLALQEHNTRYGGHTCVTNHYDLCDRCYSIFDKWITTVAKPKKKESDNND